MKFLHLSDLHIGKRVNEISMLDDQRYILKEILKIADAQCPDGVLIAGDVYDKPVPPADAVSVFDDFLTALCQKNLPVFLISGNHDSAERLSFGSRLMEKTKVYIAGTVEEDLKKISLQDEYGTLNIYLLPFLRPGTVTELLARCRVDENERNLLVAHQFVTAGGQEPERSDSESLSLGGVDNLDSSLFEKFDYVALGHLHGPQRIGRETARYAGSPLKYSFSECRQKKAVTVVELLEKGRVLVEKIPLIPLRDLREIKGTLNALTSPEVYQLCNREDYIRAVLTDEEELLDAIGALRAIYPNVMRLDFENRRSRVNENSKTAAGNVTQKTAEQLFGEFFENQNNIPMTKEQELILRGILEALEEAQ